MNVTTKTDTNTETAEPSRPEIAVTAALAYKWVSDTRRKGASHGQEQRIGQGERQ